MTKGEEKKIGKNKILKKHLVWGLQEVTQHLQI